MINVKGKGDLPQAFSLSDFEGDNGEGILSADEQAQLQELWLGSKSGATSTTGTKLRLPLQIALLISPAALFSAKQLHKLKDDRLQILLVSLQCFMIRFTN